MGRAVNGLPHIARSGYRSVCARPGLIAALYATNLAFTALVAWLAASPLGSLLAQHPPSTLAWATLLDQGSPLIPGIGVRLGAFVLVYGLLASWPLAAGISLLSHSRWVSALGKPALRVLLLRCLLGVALAALVVGWTMSARWGYRESLGFADERLLWATQVAVGVPFLVALSLVSMLGHYAQIALIVSEQATQAAIRQALSLLKRHPMTATGLWLSMWVALLLLTAAGLRTSGMLATPLTASVLPQLAVCLKVAVALWAWAAGTLLIREA